MSTTSETEVFTLKIEDHQGRPVWLRREGRPVELTRRKALRNFIRNLARAGTSKVAIYRNGEPFTYTMKATPVRLFNALEGNPLVAPAGSVWYAVPGSSPGTANLWRGVEMPTHSKGQKPTPPEHQVTGPLILNVEATKFARVGLDVDLLMPGEQSKTPANAPLEPHLQCPAGCTHTAAEHEAFDTGLTDGELGGQRIPDHYAAADSLRLAYQAGESVGILNRRRRHEHEEASA